MMLKCLSDTHIQWVIVWCLGSAAYNKKQGCKRPGMGTILKIILFHVCYPECPNGDRAGLMSAANRSVF